MSEDFIHNFTGFHGTPSRCHIRILNETNKPLVIMCTQVAEKPGTSVTNMAEYIAIDMQHYLERDNLTLSSAISHYLRKKKLSEMLGDLIGGLKKSNKYTIFALESIKLALEYKVQQKIVKDKINDFIWVEHYPTEVGIHHDGSYAVVTFEKETWQPNWRGGSIESISKYTGYPSEKFTTPVESLKKT